MKSSFNDLINGDVPVLIDFYADWCAPCKMMPPILKEVKSALGDRLKIIKIDVDANQAAASAYNVGSIPTLILFKSGRILWQQPGVVQAQELIKQIESRI